MYLLDPVNQLSMRSEFAEGILGVAELCNWTDEDLDDFQTYLLEELAYIDNLMYDVYEETRNRRMAVSVWDEAMENLRQWLSLIFGVRIRYV